MKKVLMFVLLSLTVIGNASNFYLEKALDDGVFTVEYFIRDESFPYKVSLFGDTISSVNVFSPQLFDINTNLISLEDSKDFEALKEARRICGHDS